ncbi:MAG: hypothetical protein ACE10D_04735, partial [Planctomycetota bacterium]
RRYRPIEPQKGKTGYSVVHPDHRPKDELLPSLAEVRPGERMTVQLRITCREPQSYVMIEDPLPAGCEVLEGHETGNFARKERRDTRVVFFASRLPAGTTVFTYRIQAIFPGEYAVLPATAGPMYRPATYGRSAGGTLAVTRGRRDVQEHALPTPDELWLRAQELIREKKWADARVVLEDLRSSYKLRDAIEEELYVRLLRIDLETGRAEGVVAAYEELRARNSQRLTAFAGMSDQLRIGQAYQTQKQPRLAIGLFMNVVGLSYSTERQLAQTYRRIGDPARSLEQLIGAGLRYPDDGPVSNDLYGAAEEYRKLRRPAGGLMLAESLGLLRAYTALYPAAHNVDVAAFRTIELLTSLRRHDRAVVQATHFERRYPRSRYLDDAITFLMKAHFARREFPKASEAATLLLSRDFPTDRDPRRQAKSPFRPAAHHVLGKIAHAEGKLEEAVRQYRSGRSVPDASEALAFLEERTLEVEPLARARLAARPELLLTVKNVTGLQARIYPVDLFVLLAVRPSLTDLHKVDLTGIAPVATQKIPLQNVRPYRSAERRVQLELGGQGEPGAFLVTLKAGALERSTVFLLSDLHLELQRAGGKLRVYATVPGPGGALPAKDVFVKVSDGSRVRASGKTDVRGVFEAGGIGKTAAVVAERDGHYAIARLGPG